MQVIYTSAQFSQTMGAFHSTKISGNSGSNSNGTEIFRKLVSKILVNLSRLSFYSEIWKFRKFPVPFGISTRYESAPVPLVVKSYKMAASRHYTGCKTVCHSSSLLLTAYPPQKRQDLPLQKIVDWSFRISCGHLPGLNNLLRENFVGFLSRKFLISYCPCFC